MGTELQTYNKNDKLMIWAQRVKACRESGQSVTRWCEENGIKKTTYYEWQRKIFKASQEATPKFVEITGDKEDKPESIAKIRKNNIEIEIYTAEALMEVLRQC